MIKITISFSLCGNEITSFIKLDSPNEIERVIEVLEIEVAPYANESAEGTIKTCIIVNMTGNIKNVDENIETTRNISESTSIDFFTKVGESSDTFFALAREIGQIVKSFK